jgi:ech hydrogenase subunit A
MVGPLLNAFIVPGVTKLYGAQGLAVLAGDLISGAGSFPVWPVFVIAVLAMLLPALFIRIKPAELRPVYLCGEQAGDSAETMEFRAAAEQNAAVSTGGFYLDSLFGEAVLNRWVNPIAIALIVITLGVVAL